MLVVVVGGVKGEVDQVKAPVQMLVRERGGKRERSIN